MARRREPLASDRADRRALWLGLSNHQTLILLAPLPFWAGWCGRDCDSNGKGRAANPLSRRPAVARVLASVSPHGLRLAALAEWQFGDARTLSQLIDLVDRRVFGTFALGVRIVACKADRSRSAQRLLLLGGWPYLAIAAGLVGLALRKRYAEVMFAALIVAGPLLAFCAMANLNLDAEVTRGMFSRFGLLPLVALAPFSALGRFFSIRSSRNRSFRRHDDRVAFCAAFVPAVCVFPLFRWQAFTMHEP